MKHYLPNSLRALFLSLAVLLSLPMLAIEVEIEGINYELVSKVKQAIVKAKSSAKYSGEVVIPESVEHEGAVYSVTSIGDDAFYECFGLTSVTIPNSVTSIGSSAFSWCSGLTSVTIPNSVTSIGNNAFSRCSGLTSVTIPNSVTSIRSHAFYGCSGLTSVTIPNSVTSIEYDAFSGCSGLTSVTIPNSVTSIGDGAFYECSGLTSVTIPNSVTSIGGEAFRGCSGLTSVTIGNSVTSIGDAAFYSCKGLTSVTIPNSVTSIGNCAFQYCSGLTSVTIGNSVTSIGGSAFWGCSRMTSVTIPNSVTSIGSNAFWSCYGMTSVTIGNSVTSIENGAFEGCSSLTSVHISDIAAWCNIDFADYYSNPLLCAHHLYFNGEEVKDLVIPNSVTSIGDNAFRNCSCLTSVTIPNSVTSIGNYAFAYCPELLDVYCYAENVPSTASNTFESSPIENATLHVPVVSVESYKATEPWSRFGRNSLLPNLTLTDGEVFDNNIEQEVGTLTYTRTLPNMLWNPLYVPFKIPYEDLEENYEVAYINAMHSYDNDDNGEIDEMVMEIVKVKAGTLKPNHPYLIKAKNEEAKVMNIVQEAVTLYPAEITTLDCSSVYTKFEITGTYQKMTSGELNGSLVISTDGAWKKLSSTSTLKPFRFYLTISSREGSPVEITEEAMSRVRIRVMGEDDNETGIDEVKTANEELKSEIYDLSGRRMSAPAKGGVYIVNGKKVIY